MSRRERSGVWARLLVAGGLAWALQETWPFVASGQPAEEWHLYAWGAGLLLCGAALFQAGADLIGIAAQISRIVRASRPNDALASARWLSRRQAKREGLGEAHGLFLGVLEGLPLFINNAVHALVCAPARKGKTQSFVLPALCHDIGASRLVVDLKADLTAQTASLIRAQGQDVLTLDPALLTGEVNARFNPMQIILDDLAERAEDAMADARSMATQLHPDPVGGSRDPFWPSGTRKLLSFTIAAQCALRPEFETNLPCVFQVLSYDDALFSLLEDARDSDVLGGELSKIACNILSTNELNPKHFESFREGAIQALVAFGPSGRLAPSVDACDFRFRDLKNKKMTIFAVCDYTRMEDYAPWTGLLVWSAIREIVRENTNAPVYFILDEFTNYRLSGLPNALTALGGYGIKCLMVVQELEEIARVYGREALSTILSQTDVKQFFGVASDQTASLVSRMLGQYAVPSESFSFGDRLFDMPGVSAGTILRDLMRPDEVRQLPEDEQVIFIRNLKPIRALKIGLHEIAPYRMQITPNPLFGGKRYLGRVRMRIRLGRAWATRAGKRALPKPKRGPVIGPIFGVIKSLLPGQQVLMAGLAAILVLNFGWPYLRTEYTKSAGSFVRCSYYSVPYVTDPFTTPSGHRCPLIMWRKNGEPLR